MKKGFLILISLIAAANVSFGVSNTEGFWKNQSGSSSSDFFQDLSNPNGTWSGSKADLDAIVAQAKKNYGFENSKHLGRNATELKPATLHEMLEEIGSYGNSAHWESTLWDGAHSSDAQSGDNFLVMGTKSTAWRGPTDIVKFINPNGGEAVYDLKTGKMLLNEKMGTHNFSENGLWSSTFGEHNSNDMEPHGEKASADNRFERDGDQYKYVGILYERDPNNPDKYYLIDGQTGKRMTRRQAKEFPTTLSDMWKDQGLMCVANDAKDYEQTLHSPVNANPPSIVNADPLIASEPARLTQTPSGTVNTAPAYQTYTQDNTAMKQYMSQQLEGAYSQASAMAAEAGVGAEYQSAVAPVLSYGRSAISSIPDQQTYTIPTQVQQ